MSAAPSASELQSQLATIAESCRKQRCSELVKAVECSELSETDAAKFVAENLERFDARKRAQVLIDKMVALSKNLPPGWHPALATIPVYHRANERIIDARHDDLRYYVRDGAYHHMDGCCDSTWPCPMCRKFRRL